jgi:ethanolamine ammonia-lyase small subunit
MLNFTESQALVEEMNELFQARRLLNAAIHRAGQRLRTQHVTLNDDHARKIDTMLGEVLEIQDRRRVRGYIAGDGDAVIHTLD